MKQYNVTGMSCDACRAWVEKAVSALPGVTACSVSLLTNSMGVSGGVSDEAVIRAVENAGYGASVQTDADAAGALLIDRETPALKRRLAFSVGFLFVLIYLSMANRMADWPLPVWLPRNSVPMGLAQLALTVPVLLINREFFVSGFKGVLHGAPNMDTLVALGSSASFLWSIYALFRMPDALYFESAAMILTLITVGKLLEARSKGRTTDALKALMRMTPETAVVIRNGAEETIPVTEVQNGDFFAVRPGEHIPVDGLILDGHTAVNESALTGESIPADKGPGDAVSAATLNQSGYIRCEATRVGADTTLSQIIRTVREAAATKAPIAKIADRVSGVFVPVVVGIAAVTLAVWLLLGASFVFALARAISVLVISCPCALGLATPVAIMVGNGVGAKHGILFKTAVSLEQAGKVQIAVLDKTGTVTKGDPEVTELLPAEGISETELLAAACALENKSEHPLARAIVREAERRGMRAEDVTDFQALPGNGLKAVLNGRSLCGGSVSYITEQIGADTQILRQTESLADQGRTPLLFTRDGALLGMIAVADTLKPESSAAVAELKKMGIQVVLLTGDNVRTSRAVGGQVGIEHIIAGVLPDQKEFVIRRLQTLGKVVMVGDGINDAPALTRADTGIAIGAGTDVAVDAADIVLMNSKLRDVPAAIRLSRATMKNIRENLFWTFFYNIIGIPLAAGCLIPLLGWELHPMFGAAAMSLSSFCVVSNALRLNWCSLYNGSRDCSTRWALKPEALLPLLQEFHFGKENVLMTKTMKIEGMMCPHCEARVQKALEALDGVACVTVSHKAGTAVVMLEKAIADETLRAAVDAQGYPVLSIHEGD